MGIEDKADQLKGGAKEALGNLTDNENLANEGKADQLAGAAKELSLIHISEPTRPY